MCTPFRPKRPAKIIALSLGCQWQYRCVCQRLSRKAAVILRTCCRSAPGGGGKWQSRTPAGTGRPAESHTLGSAFPEHIGSQRAAPLGCRSDAGSGPAGPCSGPPCLPGCAPGSPSTEEGEENAIYNEDPLKPGPHVVCIFVDNAFFVTGTNESPALLLPPNQINPKAVLSTTLKLAAPHPRFSPPVTYLLIYLFVNCLVISYHTWLPMRERNSQRSSHLGIKNLLPWNLMSLYLKKVSSLSHKEFLLGSIPLYIKYENWNFDD